MGKLLIETRKVISPKRKLLFSKRETADALGISLRTIDNLLGRKEFVVRRVGRRVLIPATELERFTRRDHETRPVSKAMPSTGEDKDNSNDAATDAAAQQKE